MKKYNIARAAVSAGLAIAMTFGGIAPATMAFAATNDGQVTIAKRANGDTTTLQGYQIFKADVVDKGTSKVASNLEWASTDVETIVEAAISADATAKGNTYSGKTAQNAADYLARNTNASGTDVILSSGDLLNTIATNLRNSKTITPTVVTPDKATTGMSTGYWLFVTNKDSTNNTDTESKVDQAGTSPIYAIVGGSALNITQKAKIPTVDKFVKNDKSGSNWGKVADSQAGQEIDYKLEGTVAENVANYDTYYYKFTDNLSAGLTADPNTVQVTVTTNGTTTTIGADKYTKNYVTNSDNTSVLTIEFNDLKTAGATITKDSVVTVTYKAKLDPKKTYKLASDTTTSTTDTDYNNNPNTVKLTYSNNPNTDSKGDTQPHKVTDYTYKLNIVKESTDSATTKLKDAKFTIQATGADEGASTKYVQKDGSLNDNKYEFKTNEKGEISVKGLDAGTYTVVETEAPAGYNKVDPFTFEITPTWNDEDATKATALQSLAVSTEASYVNSSVDNNKVVNLTVKDKPGSGLPLTGQAGVTLTFVAGALVLAFGVSRVVRNRKEQDAE